MNVKQKSGKPSARVNKLALSICFGTVLSVFAVSYSPAALAAAEKEPMTLEQAVAKAGTNFGGADLSPEKDLRGKAMREAAQSYGARAGLAFRTNEIRKEMDKAAPKLDAIYNFGPLMLVDRQKDESGVLRARDVLPPVVTEDRNSFKQDSDTIVHKGGPNYHIFSQARFVSTTPTWRDYLLRNTGSATVDPVHPSLLPKNTDEQTRFQQWIAEGWNVGVKQADAIYHTDLNRLDRDFNGMVLYYELVAQKMVSLPFVATSNSGITGDAENLNINDTTLRITIMPAFRHDSSKWVPVAQ